MIISRLIQKDFSEYEEERVYSVLMNEDELRLYSEFLEEREYAKVPFKGFEKTPENLNKILRKIKQREALEAAAKQMKGKMDHPEVIYNMNKAELRRMTNPRFMRAGTYNKDLQLTPIERLNRKITLKGMDAGFESASPWSGVHGTKLGNRKIK